MALEDLLQLLAKCEAVELKQAEVMRIVMVAAAHSLASGEASPEDPEFLASAARGEALALRMIRGAAESVDKFARMAAEYAAAPGGEAVAEAVKRHSASAAAVAASAGECADFMRLVRALAAAGGGGVDSDSDSDSEAAAAVRPANGCRPTEWAN
ncbi:unnamed protein product [Urochloa humidicola]